MTKESSHSRAIFFNMYFEVLSEIRFRKHPSQSSLYFNGAEYFYRQSWSSNYLFLRVCVICFVWLMGQYWPFSVNKNYYYYYYYTKMCICMCMCIYMYMYMYMYMYIYTYTYIGHSASVCKQCCWQEDHNGIDNCTLICTAVNQNK